MRPSTKTWIVAACSAFAALFLLFSFRSAEADTTQTELFPRGTHSLLPVASEHPTQTATGALDAEVIEQPIEFPHYTHAVTLGLDCQFCHSEARKSIHAGVPPVQTCMNCHKFVKTSAPRIKKIHEYYNSGQPIPWKKVHDLPDHVNFSHKRHVRAGVQCQDCHGPVETYGVPKELQLEGGGVGPTPENAEDPLHPTGVAVMVRSQSLQMGWCLDCHASHDSINQNYGDKADLRRAELKDCWTCHK